MSIEPVHAIWLDPIPSSHRDQALKALDEGDATGFLMSAGNHHGLELVWRNMNALRSRGIYEKALIDAFTSTRGNNHGWALYDLHLMFGLIADRGRLRAAGDPLPGKGPFTIYRGVAGHGPARRIRGLSWTADVEKAWWFAQRLPWLTDPAVFQITIQAEDVLAYDNQSHEQEFIVLLPPSVCPGRMAQPPNIADTLKLSLISSLQNYIQG